MHEVHVEVVGVQLLQGVAKSHLDVLGAVVELEKLGSDPDVFPGHTRRLDADADFAFVAIAPSTARINVSTSFTHTVWTNSM